MMKKGATTAFVLAVLVIGIAGAVLLYSGASGTTGAAPYPGDTPGAGGSAHLDPGQQQIINWFQCCMTNAKDFQNKLPNGDVNEFCTENKKQALTILKNTGSAGQALDFLKSKLSTCGGCSGVGTPCTIGGTPGCCTGLFCDPQSLICAVPECSDGTDNDGDGLVDSADPDCHTDGNPDNPKSYDPNDDNEACAKGQNGAACDTVNGCNDAKLTCDTTACTCGCVKGQGNPAAECDPMNQVCANPSETCDPNGCSCDCVKGQNGATCDAANGCNNGACDLATCMCPGGGTTTTTTTTTTTEEPSTTTTEEPSTTTTTTPCLQTGVTCDPDVLCCNSCSDSEGPAFNTCT